MKSKKIAFGGIAVAVSIVFMLLTGIFPFAEYSLPALAGATLVSLVIEFDKRTALIAYAAVAILSLFVAPNKEAAVLFALLLGYYPILKSALEKIKSRAAEWTVKILVFNLALAAGYFVLIHLMGMTELLPKVEYAVLALLVIGNAAFVLYDIALSRVIWFYCKNIRPKIKI